MEKNIDCMKYRKSTHLAGVDVDMMTGETGDCVLTIKEAFYDKGVNVSGNKTDGYFLEFEEDVKGMVVNSKNRVTIATIVKMQTNCTNKESRNIGNWKGLKIHLYFDEKVTMMGKVTGGIRVRLKVNKPNISDVNGKAILNNSKTIKELSENWSKLTKSEQALPSIVALKDSLKAELND